MVIFKPGGTVEAKKDNKVIFTGSKQNGLICLDLKPLQQAIAYVATQDTPAPRASQSSVPTEATESKISLWHRRLGHISLKAVEQLAETGAVEGIDISGPRETKQPGDHACAGCLAGKMHESFHKTTDTRATRPLERIHADISGIKSKLARGYRYFLLFVDDYSRYY